MIKISNPADCCGCTACASVCTHDAISMEPDVMGFLYPKVNESRCVECGLCEKVCAFHPDYDRSLNLAIPEAYGVRHKDMEQVMRSQSGAAFAAISDYVLEQGGVVYGAGYKDHFRVAHKRATTKAERDEFRGSKYVQSDLSGVFRHVRQDLRSGMMVLFSGTPCQTAGLHSYVCAGGGKSLRNNLILVDLICHGVPSPYLWRDYLSYLERKQHDSICSVNFRDKIYNWGSHVESYRYEKSKSRKSHTFWTNLFYQHLMLRHSCGQCRYCNLERPSDITIADLWNLQKVLPGCHNDHKGYSLMLVNTERGREIARLIRSNLRMTPVMLKDCMQPNLQHPSTLHPDRNQFETDYATYGFERALRKHGLMRWSLIISMRIQKIRRYCVLLIPAPIKATIKMFLRKS